MRVPLSVFIATTFILLASTAGTAAAAVFTGKVTTAGRPAAAGAPAAGTPAAGTPGDAPVAGAMVTFRFGSPFQERTVFTADDGGYRVVDLPASTDYTIRVRRIGWQDLRTMGQSGAEGDSNRLDFTLARHTNAADVAEQLPANHWYALLLEEISDERLHEQMLRQCTYCHQQGSSHTRVMRDIEEWE
jgi:hypothetical protein